MRDMSSLEVLALRVLSVVRAFLFWCLAEEEEEDDSSSEEEPDADEPDEPDEPDAEEPDAEEPDAEEPDAEEPDAEEPEEEPESDSSSDSEEDSSSISSALDMKRSSFPAFATAAYMSSLWSTRFGSLILYALARRQSSLSVSEVVLARQTRPWSSQT